MAGDYGERLDLECIIRDDAVAPRFLRGVRSELNESSGMNPDGTSERI